MSWIYVAKQILKTNSGQININIYLENNSMLKNTYSPLPIMLSSSAASIISRIVLGFAHIMITGKWIFNELFRRNLFEATVMFISAFLSTFRRSLFDN